MLPPSVDKKGPEAACIMRRAKNHVLVSDKLYKRGAGSGVLMKCVPTEEGKGILHYIHDRSCGSHAASRTLVGKAFRFGFYWPMALADAEDIVRRCPGCQYFAKQIHVPTHNLITIPPS